MAFCRVNKATNVICVHACESGLVGRHRCVYSFVTVISGQFCAESLPWVENNVRNTKWMTGASRTSYVPVFIAVHLSTAFMRPFQTRPFGQAVYSSCVLRLSDKRARKASAGRSHSFAANAGCGQAKQALNFAVTGSLITWERSAMCGIHQGGYAKRG